MKKICGVRAFFMEFKKGRVEFLMRDDEKKAFDCVGEMSLFFIGKLFALDDVERFFIIENF